MLGAFNLCSKNLNNNKINLDVMAEKGEILYNESEKAFKNIMNNIFGLN